MAASDHRTNIVPALRLSSHPLDDDELAARLKIEPRQTVNQICRRMRDEGVLDRVAGPNGKLVNVLQARSSSAHIHPPTDAPSDLGKTPEPLVKPADRHVDDEVARVAGNSSEQRGAEVHMLRGLSHSLGRELLPTRIALPSGVRVEVDGADTERTILVECWAHIGGVKGAQRLKVLTDAFKLTWIADNIPGRPRLILCMADEDAARPFLSRRAWYGQALADQGVEVIVVPLPTMIRESVLRAQQRQYR